MSSSGFVIERFILANATDVQWEQFFALMHALHWELRDDPEDVPLPTEIEKGFIINPGSEHHSYRWVAWTRDRRQLIGHCHLRTHSAGQPGYESNKYIAHLEIHVAQDQRRCGLGSELLRTALEYEAAEGIRVIQQNVFHPTGRAFCERLGGVMAIEAAVNRLRLAEVDWDMIEAWAAEGPKRAKGVRLEMFCDVPESDLEAYCKLYTETMNQQPMGKLEGDMIVTPDRRREDEDRYRKMGLHWLTMITREPDGAISGLTEIIRVPGEEHRAHQLLTGVRDAYRGRGLGKWLKAAMLLYAREHYPDLKMILTGNADVNAPMLSINNRMGYARYLDEAEFKFNVRDLRARLGI